MAAGSLIGFGLLFVAVTWMASAAMSLWFFAARRGLRQRGAWAERRAAVLVLLVPPIVGCMITGTLATFSLVAATDHCLEHVDHLHLHLCLVHGAAWPAKAWALVLVCAVAATVLSRLAARIHSVHRSRQLLREVTAFSTPAPEQGADVMLVPTDRALCFTAGVRRPRIYVSRSVWQWLVPRERAAMLAHERAHVAHGDTWRGSLLSALALFGAPLLASRVLDHWRNACERLCDRAAAAAVGSDTDVASAIASVSRLVLRATEPVFAFVSGGDEVGDRIHAVMNEQRDGSDSAATLSNIAAASVLGLTLASIVLAAPLHHALETLLGTL